jgi:hypothetical protein
VPSDAGPVRNEHGLIPGTKAAIVFDLITRPGGATTSEIRKAAGTVYISQAVDRIKKMVRGFTVTIEDVEDSRESRWTGFVKR